MVVSGLNVTLTRRGSSAGMKTAFRHSVISFTLRNVKNMPYAGYTGLAPLVRTERQSTAPIDEASFTYNPESMANGTVVVPGRFAHQASVSVGSNLAGAYTYFNVTLPLHNPLPVDGVIEMVLPGSQVFSKSPSPNRTLDFTDVRDGQYYDDKSDSDWCPDAPNKPFLQCQVCVYNMGGAVGAWDARRMDL